MALPASAAIVINEIHYNPDVKTEPAEFVELFNSGASPVSLAGWAFTDGINYTFPAVTIPAGGYVVVAQNPGFLQTKFGVTGALGPFNPDGSSGISSRGEKFTLRNAAGQVEDEVEFRLGFPWPTVGDSTLPGNGNSIELIHPSLDNDLGGSWRASGSGAGGTPLVNTTLLPAAQSWKYLKGTSEASTPVTAWRQPAFDDAAWSSGALPIGYGETFIATPLSDMNSNYTAVFLRKQFTVADPAQFSRLVLESLYDDGFKMWINGVLVVDNTANMPAGEVPFNGTSATTFEQGTFGNVNMSGNPLAALVPGVNTIAVQAHNTLLSGSSDFFFDMRLIGQTGGSGGSGPSPGRINTVFATNAPPQIRQVDHTPEQPVSGQGVALTAKVTDPNGVASVSLQYQIVNPGGYIELSDPAYTNAANWITLAMGDAGANGDLVAGDDVFTALIPASVQTHRRLIRYRITVADALGSSVRVPYADDPQPNFAYFVYDGIPAWSGAVQPGAVGTNGFVFTVSSNEMNRLPTYQLIARSNSFATAVGWAPGAVNNKYGGDDYLWTGALVVDGKVYDHIGFRCRGGVWRYSMGKNAMKFRLNRGHDLEVKDNWGRKLKAPWRRLSLRANIQQGDFNHRGEQGMFESIGYRLFELAGVPSLKSVQMQLRVVDDARETVAGNQFLSDFYGIWLAVEEEDGRFLEERDLPDGNIYDMEANTGTLNHTGDKGPVDKSDLNYLLTYGSPTPTEAWWRTNLNLSVYYSYQTIIQGIHHYDIADGKNYFYYKNPETGLWTTLPWDLDLTWADNMYRSDTTRGDEPFRSRVISNFASPGTFPAISIEFRNRVREIRDLLFNNEEGFKLIEEYAYITRGANRPSIIDADRAMWDYNPVMIDGAIINTSKAGQGRFYQWPNEPTVSKSFDGCIQLMKNYVNYRSTNANLNGSATGMDGMAADAAKPNRPTVTYTGSPSYPINQLTFRSSSYSGVNPFGSLRWRVAEISYFNPVTYDPSQPLKYEAESVWESGPINPFNADVTIPANVLRVGSRYRVRVLHTDSTGRNSQWSLPHEFVCGEQINQTDLLNHLRITELMFNPAPDGYEYVELYNSSSTVALDLSGVKFTQGIDYTFPQGTLMPPGTYIVLAGTADLAGFRAYYGLDGSVTVLGQFSGGLNNAGEQLVLRTSAGGTDIVNFTYGDGRGWPPQADGTGHALVLADSALSAQGSGAGEYAGNWRSSTYLRGSPGRADVVPPAGVLLNEIVAHTDFTAEFDSNDWIELYNPTDTPITLGSGWYLSDDGGSIASLKKWMIPAATTIPAKGFVSFDEVTGFHNPTNIGFGLSKSGDEVFLSYLPGTAQDRVVDAVSFKGQENDWSLGRYPDGAPFWEALNPRTRDTANAAPTSRVVISELMFHPPDVLVGTNLADNALDEFVELAFEKATPSVIIMTNIFGPWRLNGGVEFSFPADMQMSSTERVLVVAFDPGVNPAQLAAFKQRYGITDPGQRIFGPYLGKLANNSDRIALERPQGPDVPGGAISWVVVDEVLYADQAPWPCNGDGTGNSLQRLDGLRHGSDPVNWSAEPPTAGRVRANLPPGLPSITAHPHNRIVGTNGNVSFSVSLCGTPPFTFQWQFNGAPIADATNATLNLFNVTPGSAGLYRVVVSNAAGSVTSDAATLVVQFPPIITAQPQPTTTIRDQEASFSVSVGGTPPFTYQWRLNGVTIVGATNNVLLLSNVQTNQAGDYTVVVANTAGSIVSSNAMLSLLIPATITQPPTNRTVTVSLNTAASTFDVPVFNPVHVTNTVTAIGTGALRYQWRRAGVNLPGATNTTLIISNVTPANDGAYTVVVTDNIGPAVSPVATLAVLVQPVIFQQPVAAQVVAGANATFSVAIYGYPPPFTYEWRRSSAPIYTNVSSRFTDFFTLTNVQAATVASYRVAIRNAATTGPGIGSALVPVSLLLDSDADGIPDAWESAYGPDATSLSASADLDGDGMKNSDEYLAGTDPTDSLSFLRVENIQSILSTDLRVQIEFNAVSNRTYTVLSSETASGGIWSRVGDAVAATTNRTVRVLDTRPANAPPRFYRLVTPKNQ